MTNPNLGQNWGMPYHPGNRQISPERMAYEAFERGDRYFQYDMPVAAIEGLARLGTTGTRPVHAELPDVLGAIEDQGWSFVTATTSFVQTGSSATKRVLGNVGSTEIAVHGQIVALYIFRRAEANRTG
jgi:hypothetical protein